MIQTEFALELLVDLHASQRALNVAITFSNGVSAAWPVIKSVSKTKAVTQSRGPTLTDKPCRATNCKHRGRPRHDDREVRDGILWMSRTGAPWKDMPERYPPYQTFHRRFRSWTGNEVMPAIFNRLEGLHAGATLACPSASSTRRHSLQKRSFKVGKTNRGTGSKIMASTAVCGRVGSAPERAVLARHLPRYGRGDGGSSFQQALLKVNASACKLREHSHKALRKQTRIT